MVTKCCHSRRLPDGISPAEINKPCRIQRQKTEADGATPNTHGVIDYTDDANWVTVGTAPFAFRTKRGKQVDMAGNICDVNLLKGYCNWSAMTGAITGSYRIYHIQNAKTFQVFGAVNFDEMNEYMVLDLAEIAVEHA